MIPQTLRIRGHVYLIEQVDRRVLGDDRTAEVDNETNTISIVEGVAPSREIECLLHESLHAMLCGYCYDSKVEEDIIVTLGEALTEFIKDNPSFIRHALEVLGQG